MAVDADGTLYYTLFSTRCVYRSHRQWGRHTPPVVLAGDPDADGTADGAADSARFGTPYGICLNPLNPRSLLVMDGGRVRAVDVVTGDVTTLDVKGLHRPVELVSCASGGGSHVWMSDGGDGLGGVRKRLLRLDMGSLVAEEVPHQMQCAQVLCADGAGNAICCSSCGCGGPLLWRLQPDGTTTLLAGAAGGGYRDGPPAEAQFGRHLCAAAAGDGSVVVSDCHNNRLRLVSPGGTVSTLAGSGEEGVVDGPLFKTAFELLDMAVVAPWGDVLTLDFETIDSASYRVLLRTVPTRLQPPAHLAPAPAPPHPLVALNGGLLHSGLLADVVIRVVAVGGAAQQQAGGQPAEAQGGGNGASTAQAGGPGSAATTDIPCHRNILAAASPYFKALFAGPMAQQQQQQRQQQHAAASTAGSGGTAGRKRKAAGGERTSCAGGNEPPSAAASSALSAVAVVTVEGASVDAVRAVLRHVYTGGDLGGVTAATAQDVLYLAQQWGLDGLLGACQAHVAEQLLGPGNAAEWLLCAEGRQYGAIRAAALRAVVEHFDEVRADPAQMALLKQHPELLVEALALARGAPAARVC